MKFRYTKGNYFFFQLEEKDYKKFGFTNCKKFLNAMRKELEPHERYWIKAIKSWSIKKNRRSTIDKLISKYLTGKKQEELFDE